MVEHLIENALKKQRKVITSKTAAATLNKAGKALQSVIARRIIHCGSTEGSLDR